MRREGFELSVSPPRVVYRMEGGKRLEPLEEVIAEVDDDQAGAVIEARSLLHSSRALAAAIPVVGGDCLAPIMAAPISCCLCWWAHTRTWVVPAVCFAVEDL